MCPPDNSVRVVHVDDNRADAVTVQRLVHDIAPEVELVSLQSGEALLELLARPDEPARTSLILMDLRMPRMSGYQSIRYLKSDTALAEIPVVVLSSSRSPGDVNMAYEQGADAYVMKSDDLGRYRTKLAATLFLWCDLYTRGRSSVSDTGRAALTAALAGNVGGMRALVVEDSAADATLLRRHLESLPHRVLQCDFAADLQEAQWYLESQRYDLAFLDYRLPDGSGLEIVERLQHMFDDAGTILLTGYGDERVVADALRVGVDAYLPKRDVDEAALEVTIGQALERARQRRDAHVDPLTGLNNRGAFQERLLEEMNRCCRYGGRFVLMLIDLDDFKRINDSFGHVVGDDLLRQCAANLRTVLRRDDFIARYGGDEFCVIAHDSAGEQAEWLAHRLRDCVAATTFHCGTERHAVHIGCSIGLAKVDATSGNDPDALLERVDAAMYAAKQLDGGGVQVAARDGPGC